MYCDVSQTLLAWDQCLAKQKTFEAFEEIIFASEDQESLLSRLGRNGPAMIRIRYYFFLGCPDFEVLSEQCWHTLKDSLWKIKEHSVAHHPESLNLFLRRMVAKNRENFVAFFFKKLSQLKEEKDNPEKQNKWKLKLAIEGLSTLKEEFLQEIDLEFGKYLSVSSCH